MNSNIVPFTNKHVLCVTLLFAGVTLSFAAPPPALDGYRWVQDERFSDEFNGNTLDTNKWHDHHPRWKGRPPAKFVPSAIDVSNGCLHIRAGVLPEPDGPFTISGGAVVSRSEEAFHGYYEARMKASRISMSSTFWMSNRPQREGDAGGWILNQEISDEFEGRNLDASKWLVQGTGGEYRSKFIGRAPSQFSTRNVRVEDGKLKLQARWEPDFAFSERLDADGRKYENITTAAVVSKKQFLHGYMEIKCKAADASITSSFWATGHRSELDVFEFIGAPAQAHKKHLEQEYMFTMIDWSRRPSSRVWRGKHQLNGRVADDFHVYGCEWNEDFLKFYADGELVGSVARAELGDRWVLIHPVWLWVDSETFPWHGLPQKKDMPVDFEIEYIRVWQRK